MIHVARRLLENLRADRRRPPLERLASLDDPERFVWSVLPYAARTFSFCIAVLPKRTARALAAAYLYCRMLDTCEDLPASADAKAKALEAFLARFAAHERDAAAPIGAPPELGDAHARDDADRVYLLLLARAPLVDRFFLTLPAAQRAVVLRLVHRMGDGMIWAVRTFAAQGGSLRDREQLSRYCFEVLGNPMLFAEEMQRLECGLEPTVGPERVTLARDVGEAIQLANVARDLEKDAELGVHYLPELAAATPAGRPAAIAAARRTLLERALRCGRAFAPYMNGIPSPAVSLARGAGLLMALFTLAFWQRTAERLGLPIVAPDDRITRARSIALVARSVSSRRGSAAALARLDRIFAESAESISRMTDSTATSPALPARSSGFRDALFRWRGWAVIVLGAIVLVWQWPLTPRIPFVLAALPLVLGGVAMRVWSRCYFTRGSDTRRIQAHRFVSWGPYRRVRNPLYVGNMGVAVGLALAFAGPWAAGAFFLALLVLYSGVIRSEETVLAATYGEGYARFRQEVPRWIPRLRPLPADPEAPPAELKHALRKETQRIAGAVGAWALALVLALVVR